MTVGMGDVLGLYGAALATALAMFQYRQWRHDKERIAIDVYDEYSGPPAHVEITITYLGSAKRYIKFTGIGLSLRSWLTPWKTTLGDSAGIKACENGCLTKKGVEAEIEGGESISAYADSETYRALNVWPSLLKGFNWKWAIQVEHSLPNYQAIRFMQWDTRPFGSPRAQK
jgi:hypothetical protein